MGQTLGVVHYNVVVRVKSDGSGVDIATVAAKQLQASVDYPAIV